MSPWKAIDDNARDGREVLLRNKAGTVYAGYFGMARTSYGAGATANYPWTVLDKTNGVNYLRADSPVEYIDIEALSYTPQDRGAEQ